MNSMKDNVTFNSKNNFICKNLYLLVFKTMSSYYEYIRASQDTLYVYSLHLNNKILKHLS